MRLSLPSWALIAGFLPLLLLVEVQAEVHDMGARAEHYDVSQVYYYVSQDYDYVSQDRHYYYFIREENNYDYFIQETNHHARRRGQGHNDDQEKFDHHVEYELKYHRSHLNTHSFIRYLKTSNCLDCEFKLVARACPGDQLVEFDKPDAIVVLDCFSHFHRNDYELDHFSSYHNLLSYKFDCERFFESNPCCCRIGAGPGQEVPGNHYTDPTHGSVTFTNQTYALDQQLAYVDAQGVAVIAVDSTTTLALGTNRDSVRIVSRDVFNIGSLIVLDMAHIPYESIQNWPYGGEIDIVEQVNSVNNNQMTLHSGPGCSKDPSAAETGTAKTPYSCDYRVFEWLQCDGSLQHFIWSRFRIRRWRSLGD
ncbi:hypothetical protein RQP46_006791 [Phenoliferia psychrophenolica]